MPWTVIEWALRLVVLLIEGIPPAQRAATAVTWFWMWWPVAKLWLTKDQEEKIEKIMDQIGKS
ncbi:MAG: hypothetical protein ACRDGM_05865 [bacterium]